MDCLRIPLGSLVHSVARLQSREKLELNQLRRFRRLLRYILPRSPYYRSIVQAQGIDIDHCRPEDFPELSKEQATEHLDEILTVRDVNKRMIQEFLSRSKDPDELLQDRYFCLHTSGSSGRIGYCLFSPRDWYSGMAPALPHQPTPRGRRHRVAFIGAVKGHYAGVSITATGDKFPLSLFYRTLLLDLCDALAQNVEELNRFQPDLIVGYPSALLQLSDEQRAGRLQVRPRLIHSSGGILLPQDRRHITRVFSVPVINFYACSEHLFMGASDGTSQGMRLFEDYLYFEARPDHTLVTNLYNRTMPLIRYRMDDMLELIESPQDGPHRFVGEIVGRRQLSPVFLNRDGQEDRISVIVISTVFVQHLRHFQVQVHDRRNFTLWAVLDEGLQAGEREKAIAGLKAFWDDLLGQKRMGNVRFQICLTDQLRPDPRTGKTQLVVTDAEKRP